MGADKCKKGSACPFAHDTQELPEPQHGPKTALCKYAMQGKCMNGAACAYSTFLNEFCKKCGS